MLNKTARTSFLVFLLAILSSALPFCKRNATPFADRLVEGQQYDGHDQRLARPEDVRSILQILHTIFHSIETRDLSSLPGLINPDQGVYTDLKALRTSKDFVNDLANPDGYVNTYYLKGDSLRAHTGDQGQKSLYETLEKSEKIRVDFYFQGDECEVRLSILGDQAGESYRFNNPYFVKKDGRWYLLRLP